MTSDDALALARMRAVAARRWRLAGGLTITMVAVYFGFLSLVAWQPALLGVQITDGLSVGILLGAAVILVACLLTWVYVRWTNAVYDPMVAEQRARHTASRAAARVRNANGGGRASSASREQSDA